LPKHDPRLLALSYIELSLEHETELCAEGNILGTCKACGGQTYRDACPLCGSEDFEMSTGDEPIDDILRRRAKGEKVSLEEYFAEGGKAYPAIDKYT
jgi:hypothetical protein